MKSDIERRRYWAERRRQEKMAAAPKGRQLHRPYCPDLTKMVNHFGGYDRIPHHIHLGFDKAMQAYRAALLHPEFEKGNDGGN